MSIKPNFWTALVLISCAYIGAVSCKKDCKVSLIPFNDKNLIICDYNSVSDARQVMFSDLMDDFRIIRFENNDEAFFKRRWMFFSDNYICVTQHGGDTKLFDKNGKFIANVGGFGSGPGEYDSIIDCVIDEGNSSIYLLPFVGNKILKYDFNGEFVGAIKLNDKINKGKMFLSADSVLSVFHLCFRDQGGGFTNADILLSNPDSIRYSYSDALAINLVSNGERNGFENEIWSYRCAPNFPFTITATDTLFNYNLDNNEATAALKFNVDINAAGLDYYVLSELPHHYLISCAGDNKSQILVDKEGLDVYRAEFVNDFFGNAKLGLTIQDGYYWSVWEPASLTEFIDKTLSSGNCPEDKIAELETLKSTLHENENNILLLGHFKK